MSNQRNSLPFHVIIVAGGEGQRAAGPMPKQYALLHGKTVLRHAVEGFLGFAGLATLRVVIHPSHVAFYEEAVRGLDLMPPVFGGAKRNISVTNALQSMDDVNDDAIILIHDAARPLIDAKGVTDLLDVMLSEEAATLAVPVAETLRKGDDHDYAGPIVERSDLWALQTPQAFRFGLLKNAYAQADADSQYTDDTGLVSAQGHTVKLVKGARDNIKITYPGDLEIMEKLMATSYETRTGMGFDVHAFERQDKNRRLILCGIEIPHHAGLAGHSDADVGLHAITDALLGAAGLGDIGQYFPPSDSRFKNMDSAFFLKHAHDMVREKTGILTNIDVTLICEMPKITPYRIVMQNRIADVLGIENSRVNVKGTTTEQLGFTGRGEGIAAQAVVTLKMKTHV